MPEQIIKGRTFRVSKLLATDALRLQARVMRAVGPALDKLPAIFEGRKRIGPDGVEIEASPELAAASNLAAIRAFGDIFSHNEPDALARLIADVVEVAEIMGNSGQYVKVHFDRDFTDNLADAIPVAVLVLQEQFGDFFSGALDSGKAALRRGL